MLKCFLVADTYTHTHTHTHTYIHALYTQVGSTKQPPDFPQTLSETAVEFLKRCFAPNPKDRATANDVSVKPSIPLQNITVSFFFPFSPL